MIKDMIKLRVFLDANVFFSTFYGSANCERIIKAHQQEEISLVTSSLAIEESLRNIQEKIPGVVSSFKDLLINNPPELLADPVEIDPRIRLLVDGKDQPIFTSAILGKVNYFITGNTKDFKVKELEKVTRIKVLTPKQLVDLLRLR
jgi:predicted nucleic acid-binding protein